MVYGSDRRPMTKSGINRLKDRGDANCIVSFRKGPPTTAAE
jgi:hypothetical protein